MRDDTRGTADGTVWRWARRLLAAAVAAAASGGCAVPDDEWNPPDVPGEGGPEADDVPDGEGVPEGRDEGDVRDDGEALYTVGGTVSGLMGSGLVLRNNGGDDLEVRSNGAFVFATPLPDGWSYVVTVAAQPASPEQECTVTRGTGRIDGADVTAVEVECSTASFTVGGTVSGLEGAGLVLLDNGGDDLAIDGDGAFEFATPLPDGSAYAVTVRMQPTSPAQTCTVTDGRGTIDGADVRDVRVACATDAFTIGGTVTGLLGSGLVLRNNGGDDLAIRASGAFVFSTPIPSGETYDVTVRTQPSSPPQTCAVSGGTGTVVGGDVRSVVVNCAGGTHTVGGTVSGLAGTGLVLQNNGGDNLAISANGSFAFPTPLATGAGYAVTVLWQPTSPWQTCVVAGGTGTMGTADVTSVVVSCTTNRYTVGGTVSGLAGGGLVLRNGTGDELPVTADGPFTFPTRIASGGTYAVSVVSQPTSPWQTCVVGGGSGTVTSADVTSVVVTCTTNEYTIGGTVSGLVGAGLVLRNNGADDLAITGNGPFTFHTPVASGETYAVMVLWQPTSPSQTCTVSGGSGTVTSADVIGVAVSCTTESYTIGGTVLGLVGAGLVLRNNGGDDLPIAGNGAFTFPTPVASGMPYLVTVRTQPTGQTCTVGGGSGTVTSADVTSVVVNCSASLYIIGGTVSGLAGTGLVLQNNGGNDLAVSANGSFAFSTPLPTGAAYNVTVSVQPSSPWQTCTVTGGSGTVALADVTSVAVACATNEYTIGGTVSGLAGSGLVLRNNGGDDLAVTAAGPFAFATPVASGGTYAVTVHAQPTGLAQTCVVSAGTGTVTSAVVTSVVVTCTTNEYAIGGTVSGLTGTGLVLRNNGGDDLAIAADGPFTFATTLPDGAAYAVTVHTLPMGQLCTVANAGGTVAAAAVTDVAVTCGPDSFTIGGTVDGLTTGGLVLRNNGGDDLAIAAAGPFTFATALDPGAAYDVRVWRHPRSSTLSQTCAVTRGSGTVALADVTDVQVSCADATWTNWGFELTAPGDEPPTGFLESEGPTLYASTDETTVVNDGGHSCRIHWTVTSGSTRELVQSAYSGPAATGLQYTTHVWILDDDANGRARPFIRFHRADQTTITSEYPTTYSVDGPAWAEYTVTGSTDDSGLASLRGGVRFYEDAAPPPAGTTIFVDDFEVTTHVAFLPPDGSLEVLWGRPGTPPQLASAPLLVHAGLNDQGVLYVATSPATTAPAIDRMLFVWIGPVDAAATWAIPWNKNGTVPRPAGSGLVLAAIQEGDAASTYCEWLVASASTNWAVVPEPTAACSAPRAAVFDGTVDLTGIGGGWTAAEVPTVLSFSAISLPSADLTDLVTAEQTPACTAPCDNEVDPGELLAVHRARLLVGRMP